jgi:hypothetical protein
MTSRRFEELNEHMLKRHFEVNPHLATQFGAHDPYDYRLPDGSGKRLTDTMEILDQWYSEASEIAREERLTLDERISFEVLKVARDTHRFAIDDYPLWHMYPDALEIPGYVFLVMLNRDYWPFEKRMEAVTARIEGLPKYLSEFRTRFDGDARPVRLWTESAIASCAGFPGFLKSLTEHSEGTLDGHAMLRLEKAVHEAKKENDVHLAWLRKLEESAVDQFALGKEKLAKLLRIRGVPYTPDEVVEIAHRYLAEMKADRLRIAKGMSRAGTLEAAYEIIRDDTGRDFDEVMEETSQVVRSAKVFIRERRIATIDPAAVLKIIETPEFMADMVPTAATDLPGPFEEVPAGFYQQTRPRTEEELRGVWNHAMIVNTAVHEAYPGHFHQGVMSTKRPWMHQLLEMLMTSDTMVTAYETQEGWAHYCERMMYDQGFEHNDAAALIMLDGGIWRAVRVIYDVKLAYGESTIEEMSKLLAEEASTPLSAAESDVKNFTRTPGYPLSYLIGRHMVFELKRELEASLGAQFDLKKFHDLLASNGNLPFFLAKEAVRAGMGTETGLS